MKIVLLRVGIDTGCGGMLGPVWDDGTYELIWIPEYNVRGLTLQNSGTYSSIIGKKGKSLIEYFKPGKKQERHADCLVHVDPEFETFTYGDPSKPKGTLRNLDEGDYIVFYAGLSNIETGVAALYVIGYFEIQRSVVVESLDNYEGLLNNFGNNFHVKHKAIFQRDVTNWDRNKGLKLVKGNSNSRLLSKAYRISEFKNSSGKYILSEDGKSIFGNLSTQNDLTRNSLRWIKEEPYTSKTIEWLKSLQ